MDRVIAFPLMGNYHVPAKYLLSKISDCKVMDAPKITSKTIELGSKNSPDFVCMPFKYTLGTYIECLDMGANTLIQMGGGCRYGYYSELQEKILKDLGYDFEYYNLVSKGYADIFKIYNTLKKINPKLKKIKSIYHFIITKNMVKYIDKIEDYIRGNKGFEEVDGCFDKEFNDMLNSYLNNKGLISLYLRYKKYKKRIKNIKLKKIDKRIKIGVIGELYTLMEPFANYNIEDALYKFNVEVKRFTNVTYLLFEKGKKSKKYLKKLNNVKYKMGADALDNIYYTKYLIDNKYDGIIHIKSSFCTPEIGSMGIINKMCEENDMPVLFMSMDSNTSKVGMETRLEAFYDMIEMRKNNG